MRVRAVQAVLWTLSAVCIAVSAAPLMQRRRPNVAIALPVPPSVRFDADSVLLDSAANDAIDGDIFDASRGLDDSATTAVIAAAPPAAPPKPSLLLRGIVGGPPWNAILAGVPGTSGDVVMRRGERVGGLTLRSIEPRAVVVQGMDTSWRLKIQR